MRAGGGSDRAEQSAGAQSPRIGIAAAIRPASRKPAVRPARVGANVKAALILAALVLREYYPASAILGQF